MISPLVHSSFVIRHSSFDNGAQEIVLQGPRNANRTEFPRLYFAHDGIVDKADPVNFGSLRFQAALKQELAFLRGPFYQNRELPADEPSVFSSRNFDLLIH